MTNLSAQCHPRWTLFWTMLAAPLTTLSLWAADPATFSDGFEGATLDSFWAKTESNGTIVFPSTSPVHSGSQAVRSVTSGGGGQKQLWLTHTFAAPRYGKLSVWVYDNGNYIYFYMLAHNSALSRDASLGVQDWDASAYYYGPFNGTGGKSTVPRSTGWHQFTINATVSALTLAVDGQTVYTGAGGTPFDQVILGLSGPGDGATSFDDFSFEAAPETTGIEITSLTGNGRLTFTNAPEYLSNGLFCVEWAPDLGSAWRSNWNGLHNFAVADLTNTVEVPMFYRIKCLTNLFIPLPLRGQLVFGISNAVGNTWTEQMNVLGTVKPSAAGGKEYAVIEGVQDGGMGLRLMRSTDSAFYTFDQNTMTEIMEFQRAPVGTTWTNYNYEGQWTEKVTVEAIETVTVPAGTFPSCYKFQKQALNSGDSRPEWFEWVAPGVGLVKWVDYWVDPSENPPITHLLQSRGFLPQ